MENGKPIWLQEAIKSIIKLEADGVDSDEFWILAGLTRGIEAGRIIRGDSAFATVGLNFGATYRSDDAADLLEALGAGGLFIPTILHGVSPSGMKSPHPPTRSDLPSEALVWAGDCYDLLFPKLPNKTIGPAALLVRGYLRGVSSGTLSIGDPSLINLALKVDDAVDPVAKRELLRTLASFGAFSPQQLPGTSAFRNVISTNR